MAEYNGSIELISGLIQKNNADFPLMEASAVAFYEEVQLDDGSTAIQEIRLPDKLKQVGISEKDKEELINSAIAQTLASDAIKGFDANIKKNAEDIDILDEDLKALALVVAENAGDNKKLIVHYDTIAKKLYLYEQDENGEIEFDPGTGTVIKVNQISETTILGGGGGGGAAATYKLSFKVAENTKSSFSILDGRSASLAYNVSLSEAETDTSTGETVYNPVTSEKITYTIYKDNVYQRAITEETVKDGSIDVTDLLTLGANNFKITASVVEYVDGTNADGEAETVAVTTRASARWTVNVVNMKLTLPEKTTENKPGWDSTPFYGAIPFTYTPIGALSKTIYFDLDGKTIHKEVTSLNGSTLTYTIPKQSHGIHVLEVYCEGTIEGETIPTDKTKYILMCIDSSNTTSLIRLDAPDKGEQYSNLRVYFNVYDPLDEIIDAVEIFEDGVLKNTYTNITSTQQSWDYKPQTEGKKVITFKYKDKATESITIDVAKFPYDIQPTLGDLMVDFVPTGRTNQDIDYDVFKNNAFTTVTDPETNESIQVEIPMTWTFSDNFDWVNGGWKTDENGDAYFCVKAGTNVSFNYNLFDKTNTLTSRDAQDKYIPGIGKEFKLIFKTSNVARSDASWLTCMSEAANDNPTGIEMQVHNAYVKSSADVLEIPYSEEDIIEFDMNIVPMTEFSADNQPIFTSKVIPMILTYEDGTPVQPKVLTNPATSFKQVNPQPILVGSEYCDVHIYRMKVYERYLSEAEILNNFIADARTGEEMSKRYKRNQIYLPGQTSFMGEEQDLIALAEACPDLRVYLVSAPYFTNNKSDKVENTTIKQWYFKNGKDSLYDTWVATNAIHNGQGTSSNEYGYSGRNLEFNMKKTDFLLADNKTRDTKVPLTPTSLPTNYFNFKANIASSENANNALLQKRFDRYLPYSTVASNKDDRIKNSMEFFNCVVFIQETNEDLSTHREFNDTKIHFYGIGNIGDSKKTDSSRVNDKKDTKEFVVEIMDWNRELSNFPVETRMKAAKYKDKDKNYIFLTNKYLADKALFEKVGGEYVAAPKDEEFNASLYYFELIDGNYIVTTDSTNKNLLDPTDPESGYEDKTYYIYVGGEFKLSDDTEINLTKAYYIDILEHDDFSEDFTYGWRYITEYEEDPEKIDEGEDVEENKRKNKEVQAAARKAWKDFYRFITRDLTTDGEEDENKVAAWKNEFKDWFISDSALYYYLFTLRYTMVDNRAKNSFWHYGICPDGKYRFEFWDYDNDTALGIDNAGKLEIPFGVEDADTDRSGASYFRAYDSTFFVRVAKYFENELNDMWTRIEQNTSLGNAFDSTNFINEFDVWQSQFPEELWRLDYERKYKRPYVGGEGADWDNALPKIVDGTKVVEKRYLTEMMNGRKKYQRRQFERNQDFYMSSKFYGTKNYSNSITLRGSGSSTAHAIPAKYILTVVPFNNMYLNLHDGTNNFYHTRTYAGQTYTINLLDGLDKLDLLYIRGASNLQSLGDLSLMYLQTATLGAGAKLKNVILGNKAPEYKNAALETLEIGASNKLLEELDIRNLAYLTNTDLPVTSIPSLKRVYAQGSNIQTARFANNGLLEEAYLPASITQLQMENLYFLKTLEVESYANLTDLTIRNCSEVVKTLDIVQQSPKLNRLRLTNINWTLADENSTLLNRLVKIDSVLTGTVYVPIIRQTELEAYKAKWPELTVNYGEEMPQHSVIFRNNNEVIYTMLVDEGDVLAAEDDPVLNGTIPTPSIPNSEDGQFTYVYKTWQTIDGKPFIGTKITNTDITFDAIYETKIRTYSVKWFKDVNSDIALQTAEVEWGKSVEYDYGENNKNLPIKIPGANDNKFYLFEKWDKASTNVKDDLNIYPVWADSNPNLIGDIPTNELTAADVYGLKQVKDLSGTGKKFSTPGQVLTLQMGYMPSYANVEEDVLISSTTTFDGISQYQDTDYALFENNDSSFVLAIDFEMGNSTGTLVSCYFNNRNGFKIEPANGIGTVPSVVYKNSSKQVNVGFIAPTANRTHREICVIRKVKGDNRLYVYTNNRYSLDDIQENILFDTDTFASITTKLCFGASLRSDDSHGEYAAGTIHYAKLWLDDIGVDECKKICSWTYEKQEFEYVGKGLHFYENSDINCQATFVAKNLLDEIIAFNNFASNEVTIQGYGPSQIRQWLQKKPFLGTSLLWQQVVSKVQVPTLLGYNDINESSFGALYSEDGDAPSDYFYLPCAADLDSTFLTEEKSVYYKNESTSGQSYPIFAQNSDRIKTLGNSNIQYSYWTRSPYRSDNTMYGVVPTNRDSSSKPAGSLSNYYRSADTGEQRFFHSYSTDYQRSTKQHGVLITFSI